jgi:hypothetical protein
VAVDEGFRPRAVAVEHQRRQQKTRWRSVTAKSWTIAICGTGSVVACASSPLG